MSGTAVACSVIAGLAVAYAVEEARRLASGRRFRFVGRAQAARRIAGSLVVALLMVLVYAGLELVDPFAAPRRFVVLWSVSTLLVLLLLGLALLDLRELRAHEELERTRELLRSGRDRPPGEDQGRPPGGAPPGLQALPRSRRRPPRARRAGPSRPGSGHPSRAAPAAARSASAAADRAAP